MIQRIIPSTGEKIPVIGLGTWQTFDVKDTSEHPELEKVLLAMHESGGTMIDSSPMYGRSEQVIGEISSQMPARDDFFYATKVWTTGEAEGIRQMETSLSLMKRNSMDLVQIHNLVDWKTHLKTLRKWKEEGKTRYIGITHYVDAMHEELEKVLKEEPFDFVQFNYSILARNAEKRLLPACHELGVATIINRPFGEGKLFANVKDKLLPVWANALGIDSWAQYFLKYIISHPYISCVIPATGKPLHAVDNMEAGSDQQPDEATRRKMVEYIEHL
ncbi:MAG: aldo/keto reductase [Sediminibacterium sp.]